MTRDEFASSVRIAAVPTIEGGRTAWAIGFGDAHGRWVEPAQYRNILDGQGEADFLAAGRKRRHACSESHHHEVLQHLGAEQGRLHVVHRKLRSDASKPGSMKTTPRSPTATAGRKRLGSAHFNAISGGGGEGRQGRVEEGGRGQSDAAAGLPVFRLEDAAHNTRATVAGSGS
ncbi:MAG: hypothetical protein ACLSVD_00570 [Eggerthellaceae bacterium]